MAKKAKDGNSVGTANNVSPQSERFKKAARELGCDENEEAVDELMKRVASSPPPRKDEKTPKKEKRPRSR